MRNGGQRKKRRKQEWRKGDEGEKKGRLGGQTNGNGYRLRSSSQRWQSKKDTLCSAKTQPPPVGNVQIKRDDSGDAAPETEKEEASGRQELRLAPGAVVISFSLSPHAHEYRKRRRQRRASGFPLSDRDVFACGQPAAVPDNRNGRRGWHYWIESATRKTERSG